MTTSPVHSAQGVLKEMTSERVSERVLGDGVFRDDFSSTQYTKGPKRDDLREGL